jgi:hypothetical protein
MQLYINTSFKKYFLTYFSAKTQSIDYQLIELGIVYSLHTTFKKYSTIREKEVMRGNDVVL